MANKKIFVVEEQIVQHQFAEILSEDWPVERVICFFGHQPKGRGWTGRCSNQFITDGVNLKACLEIIKKLPLVDLRVGNAIRNPVFPKLDNVPEVAAYITGSTLRGFALDGVFYVPLMNTAYPIIEGLSWASKETR